LAGSAFENEIKLRVDGPGAARRALEGIGATLARPRHFEDNQLFDDRRRSLRLAGRVLRLRRNDQGAVVTVKGPRQELQGVKARPEAEFAVGDAGQVESALRLLGYEPAFRYEKYREVWHWKDVEIVVDETPIGTFLEIEGPLATIHAAAKALGRSPDDYVLDSYVALFIAGGGQGDMVFPEPRDE
jgi:adenylate cyclase class 2